MTRVKFKLLANIHKFKFSFVEEESLLDLDGVEAGKCSFYDRAAITQ